MTVKIDKPLKLYSHGLMSKWGFRDGSYIYEAWIIPAQDEIGYYRDEDLDKDFGWFFNAPTYHSAHGINDERFWSIVLYKLVEKYLIPELKKNHTIDGFVWIGSSHNNVRINSVDGVEVDWYKHGQGIELKPEYVEITFDEFVKFMKEEFDYVIE